MLRTVVVQLIVTGALAFGPIAAAAVDPMPLPPIWQFHLDPEDVGVKEKWFAADLPDGQWTRLSTYDWEGWEKQGQTQGVDFAWYRLRINVPAAIQEQKHVYLFFNCVDEQTWVWLNGQSVGEHTLASEGLVGSQSELRNRFWTEPFAFEIKKFRVFVF